MKDPLICRTLRPRSMAIQPNKEIVQNTINDLQRKIKDAYLVDNFDAMKDLNERMLKFASQLKNPLLIQEVNAYYQKVNLILKQRLLYAAMISQITEIFRPQQKILKPENDKIRKLEFLEEEFRNAFIDRDFSLCLKKVPEILDLAKEFNLRNKVNTYLQAKEYFELSLNRETEDNKISTQEVQEVDEPQIDPFVETEPQPKIIQHLTQKPANIKPELQIPKERLQKMEELKKEAIDFEGRLEFPKAKAIYQELIQVASEIDDRLTVTLCEQMITQIGIWVEEIENSDFSKLDIPPFRLINRSRFDCLEALSDKNAAIKKMENLISLGVKPENIKVITIARIKFKGKSPYNKNGECYAIYIRRSLE